MNGTTYYNAARAFVAFDALMVVAFTITLLGVARALSLNFVRTLAVFWLVYVVRVAERSLYFALTDRTTWLASALIGVFAMACVLPIPLVRHLVDDDALETRVLPRAVPEWGGVAFFVGAVVHALSSRLDSQGFEVAAATWSRVFAGVPLVMLLVVTGTHMRRHHAVRPLFWGFCVQLGALLIDAMIRARTFGAAFTPFDEKVVSGMTLVSTLSIGIASLLAAVEKERDVMSERAQRLQLAQERALESERWQQVGQLARGVAHDLNNVLSALLAGGDLVEEGIRHRAPETDADFTELDQALANGRSLTGRLLRFTRHQQADPRLVSVGAIGRDLSPMLRRLVGGERALHVEIADTQAVMVDPAAIEQVMLNLVVNARDATSSGGTIVLRVTDEPSVAPRAAAVGALRSVPYVSITVEDNGSGMSPDVMARLWEPFFTTKGDRGSGIGLPTVASLLQEVHGAIDVQSIDGAGSSFRVWVPVAAQGT